MIEAMPRDPSDAPSVLTIGHSNHTLDKFLGLLQQHDVEVVVDARSQPASRFSPHFGRKPLERALTAASIGYLFLGDALGGRPQARECYDADGKVDYDRIAEQPFYHRGIEQLLDGIARLRVCVLCAEEDPSHCHRRLLITRTLIARGVEVRHIRGSGAVVTEDELRARDNPRQLSLPGSGESER
ncbi:MAG TPA: DUF488 domain-containing protein [Kofleriaceae bacterium]|jgi:uncharacterized protein (DUF488 family)